MPGGKGYTITYDGVASTTIPEFLCHEVSRPLLGEVRDVFEDVPGMEGAWHIPEKRGMKKISVHASVLADTFPVNRRAAVEKIADWLDSTSLKKLIISDQPDRFDLAVVSEAPDIAEWRQRGEFTVVFSALPYSYKIAVDTQANTVNAAGSWTYTVDTLSKIVTYPIIQLRPRGGTLTGVTVTTNSRSLVHTGPVGIDDYLTINSIGYVVNTGQNQDTDLTGIVDPLTLSMATVSGFFPIFTQKTPTTNSIVFTPEVGSTATSIDVVTSWRRRYRS